MGTRYFEGTYSIGLNLFSWNANIRAWIDKTPGVPAIDTLQAMRWASEDGFDTVDVTAYYIPGYEAKSMPSRPKEEILAYTQAIRDLAGALGIEISGTGIGNDFADPNPASRALDLERAQFWIEVAAEMGAPVMRIFAGRVPADLARFGWEGVVQTRIVPALRRLAEYGADRGVRIGLQNHADMMATADQVLYTLDWVGHPNLGAVNDVGSYRSADGGNYDWYADIQKVLPRTINFQVKESPAGVESGVAFDLDRFFRDVRTSAYRGPVPIELLWASGSPRHPARRSDLPTEDIARFHRTVRAAMERTRTEPAAP